MRPPRPRPQPRQADIGPNFQIPPAAARFQENLGGDPAAAPQGGRLPRAALRQKLLALEDSRPLWLGARPAPQRQAFSK
jgi:hypothetical protein